MSYGHKSLQPHPVEVKMGEDAHTQICPLDVQNTSQQASSIVEAKK